MFPWRHLDRGSFWRGATTLKAKSPEAEPATLVRQVYLRTLSRPPDEAETARALEYMADSGDQVAGLKGLLWVLLNTKEFIVNH